MSASPLCEGHAPDPCRVPPFLVDCTSRLIVRAGEPLSNIMLCGVVHESGEGPACPLRC